MMTETPRNGLKFDGSVTITVIVLIVVQILSAMYAVGQFSHRVEALERGASLSSAVTERIARIETYLQAIDARLVRIERALDHPGGSGGARP